MTFITGLLMAIADSVPGVSGGTIAYILDQYEDLLKNINCLLNKDFNKEAVHFLIKLGIGWIIGFIGSVLIITSLFEAHIYEISSMFLGFIIISTVIVIKQESKVIKNNYKYLIASFIGFAVVIILVFFQGQTTIAIDPSSTNLLVYAYVFIVGMIAISAMLLPGVSGSAVLMIFGVYFVIMEALKDLFTLDFSEIGIVIALGLGILAGAVFAVKTINRLFESKRAMMIYLIIGLLIGSIFAIINGPLTIEGNTQALTFSTFSPLWFIVGVVLILMLEIGVKKELK